MDIDVKSAAAIMRQVGNVASAAAGFLPGVGSYIARFVSVALGFGAELADAGAEPITHIERLRSADPLLADVKSAWEKALDEKYGRRP